MLRAPDLLSMPHAGAYGLIGADPNWRFVTRGRNGHGKSAERHYRTMSFDRIAALPVARVAGRNCALFLWCTWPTIEQGLALIRAWGFKYSGLAWEWFKFNPMTGKAAFGPGYGTRKNLEPCLLAIRGSPRRLHADVRDWIVAPRREHSRKPDEQYERMERLFAGPYLEMFARQRWPGWDAWGDQVEMFSARAA